MNNRNLGLIFVLIGICFLMLSFILPKTTILWHTILGVSICANVVGTGILMKFLREKTS